MTTFSKNFRTAILGLSTVGLLLPQTVLAGGHPGGMGGASSSSFQNHTFRGPSTTTTISKNGAQQLASVSGLGSSTTQANVESASSNLPPLMTNLKNNSKAVSNSQGSTRRVARDIPNPNPSRNTMDDAGTITGVIAGVGIATGGAVEAVAAFEDGLIGILQGTSSAFSGTPGAPAPSAGNPNNLTNLSGGQYQDGTPEENPVKGNGTPSGNPNAGSAAGSAMGASASSTGSSTSNTNTVQNSKNEVGKVSAGYGDKKTGLGMTKIPDGNLAAQGHTKISDAKYPLPSSITPSPGIVSPPLPKNPTNPSGPIFGIGSSDDSTPSTTTDNSTTSTTDTPATTTPVASDSTTTPAAASGIDLVLEDVTLASPATLVAGPAYTVKFRNQGTVDAGKFEVGIFAGFAGKLAADAPRAIVEIPSLAAGESKQVTLRLPQKAMKLTGVDGKPTAFTRLFIGVDLNNTVIETDETNNTAVVDRAALETTAAN